MDTLRIASLAAVVLACLSLGTPVCAQSNETAAPSANEGARSATVLTVHGKIVEVDKAKKLVVVEVPGGQKVGVTVQNPYNLNAAQVGAPIVARFYEVVTIRKKKPGEEVPSLSLKEGIVTARPGATPGAVADVQGSVLVSVVSKDMANGTVTVSAADGTQETVKARDPKNLDLLNVGDQLVVSVSRALAISLEKDSAG